MEIKQNVYFETIRSQQFSQTLQSKFISQLVLFVIQMIIARRQSLYKVQHREGTLGCTVPQLHACNTRKMIETLVPFSCPVISHNVIPRLSLATQQSLQQSLSKIPLYGWTRCVDSIQYSGDFLQLFEGGWLIVIFEIGHANRFTVFSDSSDQTTSASIYY